MSLLQPIIITEKTIQTLKIKSRLTLLRKRKFFIKLGLVKKIRTKLTIKTNIIRKAIIILSRHYNNQNKSFHIAWYDFALIYTLKQVSSSFLFLDILHYTISALSKSSALSPVKAIFALLILLTWHYSICNT